MSDLTSGKINGSNHVQQNEDEDKPSFLKKFISPKFLLLSGVIISMVLMIEGFLCFTTCVFNIRSWILSFYYIIFGLLSIGAELKLKIIGHNLQIIFSYTGRAIWYIFLGKYYFIHFIIFKFFFV